MKKALLLVLALVMIICTTACSGISSPGKSATPVTPNEDAAENNSVAEEENEEQAPEATAPIADDIPVIAKGEAQSTANSEFYIDYVNITDDVLPPQPDSYYSHYLADDGKTYVDFCISYKNTAASDVSADEVMSGTLYYAESYQYMGFAMIEEDNRGDFTYANITSIVPLSTEYVHYLFEVPDEVGEGSASVYLKMNIDGNDYKVVVREGSSNAGTASQGNTGKTSGEVALKETLATKNCEFFVDYANITADVIPPQTNGSYSHYKADNGKVYVDICFGYKNTTGSSVGADEVVSAKLKYADKYDYKGFSMIEEANRSDFTYSNITSISPLTTEYVHYLFEVPSEIESSSASVVITFMVDGNTYTYTVR